MSDFKYCSHYDCDNAGCEHNVRHLPDGAKLICTCFPECEKYKQFLRDLQKQDEADAWDEALREAHDLDGF